jgi:hypothetical protein
VPGNSVATITRTSSQPDHAEPRPSHYISAPRERRIVSGLRD